MWGIMFSDPNLINFLKDWKHMRNLVISQAIDQDLYQIWIDREVKKYNFSIASQTSDFSDKSSSEDIKNVDDI